MNKNIRMQRGSSLIEVVVALFVLAVGMLGVLSMQVKSMQFNQSAYYYTQAVYLANDILENMRSNKQLVSGYLINLDENPPVAELNCLDSNVTCTPAQMRDYNLNQWRANIEKTLVSGRSSVENNGNYFTITVQFDDSRGEPGNKAGPVLSEYVLVTEIN